MFPWSRHIRINFWKWKLGESLHRLTTKIRWWIVQVNVSFFSITDFVMLHMLLKFISNFSEKYYRIASYKELHLVSLSWLGIFLWAYVYLPDFTYKVNDSLQGFLEFNSKWHFKHAWLLSELRLYMHDTTKYNKAWHSNENKW